MRSTSFVRLLARALLLPGAAMAAPLVAPSAVVEAQTTTANLRGQVTGANGAPIPDVTIAVRSLSTNQQRGATTNAGGTYYVGALAPGAYEVIARRIGMAPQTRTLQLQIGQTLDLDFTLNETATTLATVAVVAAPRAETRTSEVATNVTQAQINNLPTPSRNFVDLAQLAPGTRVDPDRLDGTDKSFAAGAQRSDQVNVFVDGASYKNDIIQGGLAGQASSRGNPFPRNAVQEFRVATTNFKAEYQKASSAIITAVTKSGTNSWQGSAFGEFLNEKFVALDSFSRASKATNASFKKPTVSRYLTGLSLGGPIVRDRLFFFGSYEGNYQDREGVTRFNGNPATYPAAIAAINGEQHTSPFRSHLGFGKITYNPSEKQSFEFTGDVRRETDKRRFGGQFTGRDEAFSTGEDFQSNVSTGRVRHSLFGSQWTNEALASYQSFQYKTDPFNPNTPFLQYNGIGNIGGRNAAQDLTQGRLSLRDDFSYAGWHFAGAHAVKVGANYDNVRYDLTKQLQDNPRFVFDGSNGYAFPVEGHIGVGNPSVKQTNNQVGFYAQDDWTPVPQLTINAGVRWDYESGMYNRSFVTPQKLRDSLTAYRSQLFIDIDPNRYFTNGNDRKAFLGAWQPRLGASYSLDRANRTTLFGGWGVFYDRMIFNATIDEQYNAQHPTYDFRFGTADDPANHVIKWDPSYFSRQGLLGLLNRGVVPPGEAFLLPNDLKPPKSNQWSVGARHDFGAWNAALTYTGTRSFNGFTYEWANHKLNPDGSCCVFRDFLVPAYRNVLVGRNDLKTWYDAAFLQIDRPYRSADKWNWGAGTALTYTIRSEMEGDFFGFFTFPNVRNGPRRPLPDFEKFRMVSNFVTDVPYAWGIQFSGILTLGTGRLFDKRDIAITTTSSGTITRDIVSFGVTEPKKYSFIIPHAFGFRNLDLRLRKDFANVAGNHVGVTADLFNALNTDNFGCFDTGYASNQNGQRVLNPRYGNPGCVISDARRFQLGLQYDFQPRMSGTSR